jgi:hypothetical protein
MSGVAALLAAGALTMAGSAASPRFLNDDPIQVQPDTRDAAGIKADEVSLFVDLAYNLISGAGPRAGRAGNLNSVDEVPDSSWYTNRAGARPLTADEIAIGPDTTSGPAGGSWTITSSKSDGITPGFTVNDTAGRRWFLKFDPPGYRGMATGTEVAVTKLMWALGYNVAENHIAHLRREQLAIGATATFTPKSGRKRPMRPADVDSLLAGVDRDADGTYRVVASKALDGTPIGRIRFFGTRTDDPNDIVPHEDRRELRGYGVFAAWLNHVDAKAINSLDTLVTENGRSFVRHHLLDFASALGSGRSAPPPTMRAPRTCWSRGRSAGGWRRSASCGPTGAARRFTRRRRSAGCRCRIMTSTRQGGSRRFPIGPFSRRATTTGSGRPAS